MERQLIDYAGMIADTADHFLSNSGLPRIAVAGIMKLFSRASGDEGYQLNVAVAYLQTAVRENNREMLETFYNQFQVRERYPVLYYFVEGMLPIVEEN